MVYLETVLLSKMRDLSRTLAGCSLGEPVLVADLLTQIDPKDLVDEQARGFLDLVRKSKPETVEEVFALAEKGGFLSEYASWSGPVFADFERTTAQLADRTVQAIKGLSITRLYLPQLQNYAAQLEREYGNGDRAEREREAQLIEANIIGQNR